MTNVKIQSPIRIFNSLTRKKEEFRPLNPPTVNIYTCGVTVYDECHIGHARSLYIFDVIRRYLEYRGYKVNLVRNITDIDDKIINRSNELNIPWESLVDRHIKSYYRDMESLGIEKGMLDGKEEPRATRNISEIIAFINALIEKGYAYNTATGVYFAVRKFTGYGKLSGQSIEQMLSGVRKETDETKRDPLDFALWKVSKPAEPSWPSPWGEGRPGWHIECSAMSLKYLKSETLDIHAGGRDLIFPHHENEIAQSEAFTGKTFANYWIHHGLLTINGQKMSKSLGNFVTVKDALGRCPADILKMFYLQAHYSHPIDFSWEKIGKVKKAYERIDILLGKMERMSQAGRLSQIISSEPQWLKQFKDRFIEAMDDDFNTPAGLSAVFELVNACNKLLETDEESKGLKPAYAMEAIKRMTGIFGLSFSKTSSCPAVSESGIKDKIALRLELKKQKRFTEADQIRKELENQGVILEDTPQGTLWRRRI